VPLTDHEQRKSRMITKYFFRCDIGSLPFRNLGIPHFHKLKNGEWKPVEVFFEKKLSIWIRKMFSYGDQAVLINILTSLLMFMLSFLEIGKGVRKRLDFYRSRFFCKAMLIKRSIC
jgi:hypothetical protein